MGVGGPHQQQPQARRGSSPGWMSGRGRQLPRGTTPSASSWRLAETPPSPPPSSGRSVSTQQHRALPSASSRGPAQAPPRLSGQPGSAGRTPRCHRRRPPPTRSPMRRTRPAVAAVQWLLAAAAATTMSAAAAASPAASSSSPPPPSPPSRWRLWWRGCGSTRGSGPPPPQLKSPPAGGRSSGLRQLGRAGPSGWSATTSTGSPSSGLRSWRPCGCSSKWMWYAFRKQRPASFGLAPWSASCKRPAVRLTHSMGGSGFIGASTTGAATGQQGWPPW